MPCSKNESRTPPLCPSWPQTRRKIARWHDVRMPVLEIAAHLGRHRATINGELKRNRFVDAKLQHLSGYYALNAQSKAEARRATGHQPKSSAKRSWPRWVPCPDLTHAQMNALT
jgi:hypothetical protein